MALEIRHSDWVPNANPARTNDLGQHALPVGFHQGAQALAYRVHFRAGRAGLVEVQDRSSNFYGLADETDERHALGFDVRARRARRNRLQTQRRGVLRQLFSFDQADLSFARLARKRMPSAEVTVIAHDALAFDEVNEWRAVHRRAGLGRMNVQGSDSAESNV